MTQRASSATSVGSGFSLDSFASATSQWSDQVEGLLNDILAASTQSDQASDLSPRIAQDATCDPRHAAHHSGLHAVYSAAVHSGRDLRSSGATGIDSPDRRHSGIASPRNCGSSAGVSRPPRGPDSAGGAAGGAEHGNIRADHGNIRAFDRTGSAVPSSTGAGTGWVRAWLRGDLDGAGDRDAAGVNAPNKQGGAPNTSNSQQGGTPNNPNNPNNKQGGSPNNGHVREDLSPDKVYVSLQRAYSARTRQILDRSSARSTATSMYSTLEAQSWVQGRDSAAGAAGLLDQRRRSSGTSAREHAPSSGGTSAREHAVSSAHRDYVVSSAQRDHTVSSAQRDALSPNHPGYPRLYLGDLVAPHTAAGTAAPAGGSGPASGSADSAVDSSAADVQPTLRPPGLQPAALRDARLQPATLKVPGLQPADAMSPPARVLDSSVPQSDGAVPQSDGAVPQSVLDAWQREWPQLQSLWQEGRCEAAQMAVESLEAETGVSRGAVAHSAPQFAPSLRDAEARLQALAEFRTALADRQDYTQSSKAPLQVRRLC